MGPMTGRAAGYCAGYAAPGHMNPIPGRGAWGRGGGFGRGRGFGRGLGRGRGAGWGAVAYAPPYAAPAYAPPFAPPTALQERDALQGQLEYLEDALDGVRKRLAELESAKDDAR